ncbi:MAG: YueI family protein [Halanaerobacter sp.]
MSEDDVENDVEREAMRKQQKKSELEQKAAAAINGGPDLKRAEKNKFLGEFKERVLIALTFIQVEEEGTYREVLEAIKDKEAVKLIIDRGVEMAKARDYIKLAQKNDLSFKKIEAVRGSQIALVVVSDHAVHRDNIYVTSRKKRLQEKGIPLALINARGEKICEDCYNLIKEKAPEELDNYQKMSWFDKLIGTKCPVDHD